MGMKTFQVPLHGAILYSHLVQALAAIGVHSALPIEGIILILRMVWWEAVFGLMVSRYCLLILCSHSSKSSLMKLRLTFLRFTLLVKRHVLW